MTKHHTAITAVEAYRKGFEEPFEGPLPKYVVAVQGHPVLWTDNDDDARIARAEHPGAVIYTPRLDPDLAFHQFVDRDTEGYRAWLAGRGSSSEHHDHVAYVVRPAGIWGPFPAGEVPEALTEEPGFLLVTGPDSEATERAAVLAARYPGGAWD